MKTDGCGYDFPRIAIDKQTASKDKKVNTLQPDSSNNNG